MNPQIKYGEDIIARFLYARASRENAARMGEIVVDTLNRMIFDLCKGAGLPVDDIFEIVVVCNTVGLGSRLALISGSKREEAIQIADRIEYIELATFPDFSSIFAEAMYLGQIPM